MIATFYHNPRCSKSRQALALLQQRGIEPTVIHYLDTPPSAAQLRELLGLLGLPARALLRTGEEEYRALQLDNPALDEETLIQAMCQHPRLIERPVAIHGQRAVIGRPAEKILEIF